MILGVGNDVQDALVRQTIGIGPYLSFPRVDNAPVQWVQLLNGFDQQDLYGWPLLTQLKVQMQKCDKCSREFCSTVNYRRHIRLHRRLNVDKESYKNRDSLGAFWDKVSLDEAKKILSFKDVILEGLHGSSIIKALASFVRSPGFCALPQVYVKAGHVLLDVIEATPSKLPISSQEFFTVLDDASERTFLCGGTAGSVQKFIFDGEAEKVVLEMKNLVACTSFVVEQNLVKAWIADKDAEALRCQKLLVEEEEAAQKRQAELLERKRLRKLRHKEQKTKGRSFKETTKLTGAADILENVPYGESSTSPQSEGDIHALSSPPQSEGDIHALSSPPQSEGDIHAPPQSEGDLHALEDQNFSLTEPIHLSNNEVNGHIDIEGGYNNELLDLGRENDRECVTALLHEGEISETEVMIGSITVTLRNHITQKQHEDSQSKSLQESCNIYHVTYGDVGAPESNMSNTLLYDDRLGIHVNGHEVKSQFVVQSGVTGVSTVPSKCSLGSFEVDDNDSKQQEFIQPAKLAISSHSARAFLAQRWKEAISRDHETLVMSQEPERQGHGDVTNDCSEEVSIVKAIDSEKRSILGSAENRLDIVGELEYPTNRPANGNGKRRNPPKKGYLIKVQ